MAGVKGRSGGARPGSGPKPRGFVVSEHSDPLAFLLAVMQGHAEANATQVRAAIAAAQYVHMKKGDAGKKDEREEAAARAAAKFNTPRVPLKVVGG